MVILFLVNYKKGTQTLIIIHVCKFVSSSLIQHSKAWLNLFKQHVSLLPDIKDLTYCFCCSGSCPCKVVFLVFIKQPAKRQPRTLPHEEVFLWLNRSVECRQYSQIHQTYFWVQAPNKELALLYYYWAA
jgi:hypothetical protein